MKRAVHAVDNLGDPVQIPPNGVVLGAGGRHIKWLYLPGGAETPGPAPGCASQSEMAGGSGGVPDSMQTKDTTERREEKKGAAQQEEGRALRIGARLIPRGSIKKPVRTAAADVRPQPREPFWRTKRWRPIVETVAALDWRASAEEKGSGALPVATERGSLG